jgi:hypothetical protein
VFYDDALVVVPATAAFKAFTLGIGGSWSAPGNLAKARRKNQLAADVRSGSQPAALASQYEGSRMFAASDITTVHLRAKRLGGREMAFETADGSSFSHGYPKRHLDDKHAIAVLRKVVGDRLQSELAGT